MNDSFMEGSLGIYIHIPFCIKKCAYCDFLSLPPKGGERESYTEALLREIRESDAAGGRVATVFFGGGTPTLMKPLLISKILDELLRKYEINADAEMTIEANPGTVSHEELCAYRAMGFNRLSFGVQSFDDGELRLLGRIHTREQAAWSFDSARRAGFENINLDLMASLPGQSSESFDKTLRAAIALEPEHISCYDLIIEEGTPFYDRYKNGEGLPDDEEVRELDRLARRLLSSARYERYEVSNFAKSGYECRHNLGCWRRYGYRGYGVGAASLIKGKDGEWRFTAERDMDVYMSCSHLPLKERMGASEPLRRLDKKEAMEEFMFLGLRCISGVCSKDFSSAFGEDIRSVYGRALDKYTSAGFLRYDEIEDRWALTGEGLDVSNVILADFLL